MEAAGNPIANVPPKAPLKIPERCAGGIKLALPVGSINIFLRRHFG